MKPSKNQEKLDSINHLHNTDHLQTEDQEQEQEVVIPETRVVNKYKEEYDIYIGRGSIWGNPFKTGKDGDRDEVIALYRRWLFTRKDLLAKLDQLEGKRLGCFCAPKSCHGDVLVSALKAKQNGLI